jgi:hypothetical protein
MLDHPPHEKREAFPVPDAVLDGALLRPFGFDGYFGYYYYAHAGSRAVA